MNQPLRIVLIGCARSAGMTIQELQSGGQRLPDGVEWVSMPCGGSIDTIHILRAFESGADRVMVLACYEDACHSVDGPKWAEKRVAAARAVLQEVGIPGEYLRFHNIGPNMPVDLLAWLQHWPEPAPASVAAEQPA